MKLVARVGLTLAFVAAAACGGKQTQSPNPPGSGGEGTADSAAGEAAVGTEGAAPVGAQTQREWPTSAQAMPDTMLASLVIDNPNAQLGAIRDAVSQLQPALAGMVHAGFLDQAIAEVAGVQRVAGLDYSKPLRVLLLDPMAISAPAIVIAGVADEGALRQAVGDGGIEVVAHDGVVVMGAAPALDAAFGYAATELLGEPVPAKPTATLHLGKFLAAHAQQLDAMMPMMQASMASSMPPDEAASAQAAVEGVISFVKQIDQVKLSLDASANGVTVSMAASPMDNSDLATFIGKQKPASFAQLGNVEPGMFVMAGRMDWKELYEKMMAFAGAAYKKMYGEQTEAMMEMQKAWVELMGEEFAMTGGYDAGKGVWMGGTWEIEDAKKVNQVLNKYFKKMPKKIGQKGVEMKLKFRRNAMRHRGVGVNEMAMTFAKGLPPEAVAALAKIFGKGGMKVLFGAFAKTSVMAMGSDAKARVKAAIDVSKGKKPAFAANPGLESALAQAKQLKESMVFALDLPPVVAAANGAPAVAPGSAGEPAVFALGFADGTIGARITVPMTQVKALMPPGAP